MKLAENLYVYEWKNYFENNCNSFFIGGSVGALVDPGLSQHLPDLLKRMAKDGIKKEDIKAVVNTHSHPDHYEASALFDSSQVKIALSEIEMGFMQGPGATLYQLFGLKAPVVDVNLPLKEGEVKLGEETFEISIVPGHSPGSIGLYWPAKKALDPALPSSLTNASRSAGSWSRLSVCSPAMNAISWQKANTWSNRFLDSTPFSQFMGTVPRPPV